MVMLIVIVLILKNRGYKRFKLKEEPFCLRELNISRFYRHLIMKRMLKVCKKIIAKRLEVLKNAEIVCLT